MKFTTAVVGVLAAASCASAFVAPGAAVTRAVTAPRAVSRLNAGGKYDGKLWDDGKRRGSPQCCRAQQLWCPEGGAADGSCAVEVL